MNYMNSKTIMKIAKISIQQIETEVNQNEDGRKMQVQNTEDEQANIYTEKKEEKFLL